MNKSVVPFLILVMASAGCASGPATLSASDQIRIAVEQTIAAIPTDTPHPLPTFPPKPTAVSLAGLYCEYQFCIGHPNDVVFYDVIAKQNPGSPSASQISSGILAGYTMNSLFIQLIWQNAPGATDAQFMIDLILQYGADSRTGSPQSLSVGGLSVFYTPITPTSSAASSLPYGGAAAWICGPRAFAWKAYTTQPNLAQNMLQQALSRFSCSP